MKNIKNKKSQDALKDKIKSNEFKVIWVNLTNQLSEKFNIKI